MFKVKVVSSVFKLVSFHSSKFFCLIESLQVFNCLSYKNVLKVIIIFIIILSIIIVIIILIALNRVAMYWLLGLLCAVPGYLHALGMNMISNDILFDP